MKSYGETYEEAAAIYREADGSMACTSARVESGGYGVWPRIREVMEFARMSGFNKLGLAFCVGLRKEAAEVNRIFENNGFTVASVMCKTGSRPKEELGLRDDEKVRPGQSEAMCNPVVQALLLNKEQTDLNILLGLCVGHDTIFIKHSKAPITVLAVKDRATGHNPMAAIYAGHYFQSKVNLK
jgi:uncharacterized metal-binding protein